MSAPDPPGALSEFSQSPLYVVYTMTAGSTAVEKHID